MRRRALLAALPAALTAGCSALSPDSRSTPRVACSDAPDGWTQYRGGATRTNARDLEIDPDALGTPEPVVPDGAAAGGVETGTEQGRAGAVGAVDGPVSLDATGFYYVPGPVERLHRVPFD